MMFTRAIDYSTIIIPMVDRQELIHVMGRFGYQFIRERCVGDDHISMIFYKIIPKSKL